MPFDLQDAIKKNARALEACRKSKARLASIPALIGEDEQDRIAELSRASNEETDLEELDAHLRASAQVVQPLDNETAEELNELDNALDDKIRENLIIGGTVDFISGVLNDVTKVRTIIEDHT
jgi:hypothetical protein